MKKLHNILFYGLAVLIFFSACDDEFDAPTKEPSNVHVTTGFNNGTPVVQVNGFETFADLSPGVKSRLWTFPGAGLTDIETSKDAVVRVQFLKTGTYDVTINQTFNEAPWDWRKNEFRSSTTIDSVMSVRVIDSIKSTLEIYYVAIDGSDSIQMNLSEGALNQLMAGEVIRIKHTTVGEPSLFEFSSDGSAPVSVTDADSVIEMKFKRLGNYGFEYRASRTKPVGSFELAFENLIEVIPSTRPVALESVIRYDENTVALNFSRSIDDPSGDAENFSVRAKNTVRTALGIPKAFDELLPIEEVVTGSGEEDNVVLIHLGDNIYNSDSVFVSYTAGGVKSSDGIAVDTFSEEVLDFQRTNRAAQYGGFEDLGAGWKQYDEGPRTDAGYGEFSFSTEKPHSGDYSLWLSTDRDENDLAEWIEVVVDVDLTSEDAAFAYNAVAVEEGDKFYISYYIYVVETNPIGPDVWEASSMYLWLMADKLKIVEYRSNKATHPIGEWVKIDGVWGGIDGATGTAVLRPYFRSIGNITLFIDDLEIYDYEERPGF